MALQTDFTDPVLPRYTLKDFVCVVESPGKGRGVFAARNFQVGETVAVNPVILIEIDALRDGSIFNDYPLDWTDQHNAIALGPINLLNHSEEPNCKLERHIEHKTVSCIALEDIQKGAELTIRYLCPVWF